MDVCGLPLPAAIMFTLYIMWDCRAEINLGVHNSFTKEMNTASWILISGELVQWTLVTVTFR